MQTMKLCARGWASKHTQWESQVFRAATHWPSIPWQDTSAHTAGDQHHYRVHTKNTP